MKCIFLSDAHLKNRLDPCHADLLRFLDELQKKGIDHLFILGDFFDFWFCKDHHIFPDFREVIEALVMLKAAGTRIAICEGNHDFFLSSYFHEKLGMEVFEDWAILDLDGRKTLLAHGDLVDQQNKPYLMLRKALRSRFFYQIQKRIPSAVLWRLARLCSHTSRNLPGESGDRLVGKMLAFTKDKFRDGFDTVILGHSHKPSLEESLLNGRKKTFATLGDWTRHESYLQYEDGHFQLSYYRKPT